MAHSKYRVFEEERNILYLSMDGDNRLTGDPKEIDRIMERKKKTDIRIYRMLTGAADSDEFSESEDDAIDDRPKVKLIVEEVLPDGGEDDKPPDPVGDFVDPLSQLDTEQMLRLKTALASEQAKQILGDNVTAMLDVLSVDDTTFLRNSIMQDHCYTPLSPSEDPKGPSFVQFNNPPETHRRPVGRPAKYSDKPKSSTVVRSDTASPLMPDSDDQDDNDKEYADTPEDSETDGEDGSDSDYRDRNSVGFGVRTRRRGGARARGSSFRGRHKRNSGRSPRREREEPPKEVKPQQAPVVTKIIKNYAVMKRGRPRRGGSTTAHRPVTAPKGPTVPSSPAPEPELPVDHVAAKMYSNDAIRLGRSGKTEEERRKEIVRVLQNLPFSQKVSRTILTGNRTQAAQPRQIVPPAAASTSKVEIKPKVEEEVKKPVETIVKNVMGGKYPRRENRKLPSHLADSIGPEIFSMPDLLRRKPTQPAVDVNRPKPAAKVLQNPVHKYLNKTKVEAAAKEQSTDELTKNMATTVNDLQCMLEEGLNESADDEKVAADVVSNDVTPKETVSQVTERIELKPADETPSLDISQMDESLLQELPVTNMDELLQSVAAQEAKAEPLYLSGEGVCSDSGENNSQSGEGTSTVGERRRSVPKRRRSDEISSLDDSDIDDVLSEGSWNSDDDPDKLWCICRQPHNNRFMICCDVCEEWFHGKCVGIPKSIGKQMERDNLEWSCPDCRDKKGGDDKTKAEKLAKPKMHQTKLVTIAAKRPSSEENPIRKCIMCKAPARENSIYCSDQCISKHSQKALTQLNESTKVAGKSTEESITPRRIIVLDPTNKQMLTGHSAPTAGNLATWLLKHPSYRVVNPQEAPNVMRNVRKIVQIKPFAMDSKKQMTLTVSPNSKIVKVVHGNNPVLKVISPGSGLKNQVVNLLKSDSDVFTKARSDQPKIERKFVELNKAQPRRRKEKEPTATTSKTENVRERGNERAVRDSVRRTLGESLKSRVDDCEDLQVNYAEIEDLASQIEERLYKHFENKVDAKYKSKFRSLVFNIKDQKNTTLFRKIVEKAISPKELVRLSPDEMASQELAQWREKENQHQLDIIKKSELELMTQGQTFIIKSRKGEEVIEKVQNVAAEIDPNTSAQELVSALNSVSSTTPDNTVVEKTKKSETSLMKMKKREKERRREREKRRKRSRSRSRSRTSKRSKPTRKRSRSRSRDRHRRSTDKKESRNSRDTEKVREIKEEEKEQETETVEPVKEEPIEITTSGDVEQKIQDPDAEETDFEPTSTVTIKTPDPQVDEIEEPEMNPVWGGQIAMAEVAKFQGIALPAAGECESISIDLGEKLNVIGRIGYSNVWDYLVKMKLSASKEILILQILPKDTDQDRLAFSNLHCYLEKRSRIAVIKPANDRVKDFYLYPQKEGSVIPLHLQPITIPLKFEKRRMLFGIVVRTKKGTKAAASTQKYASNSPLFKVPLPPPSPESTSKSKISQLPLPEPHPSLKHKLDSKVKKKVRVLVQPVEKTDDGDSPYSPASSDEDLPPIIPKKLPEKEVITPIETDEIQKKIDEMNRAIEEQTQQIQNLASTVPLLPVIAPVLAASFPTVATADVASLNSSLKALTSILTTPMDTDIEIVDLDKSPVPMDIDEPTTSEPMMSEEPYSPSGSLSPTPEEPPVPAPMVLPQEVAKISIPSNLQEILASIKQTVPDHIDVAPSPPNSPKSSPRASDSPEPLPPGIDHSPPEPPKIVIRDDDDEAPPVKITPKKPIKFDIKINQKTKAMLAEAANDHILSRTDRDERYIPEVAEISEKSEKPEKSTVDTEAKPARVAHRTPSNKDDRRSRHFGRRSDAHKSDRHRDHDRKELEAEWDGSIRKFENESRRRHREIREKEIERLRKRSDSE